MEETERGGPPAAPGALAAAPGPGSRRPDPAVGRYSPPAKRSPFAPSPLFCLVPRGNERRPLPAGARFSVAFARRDCPECSLCLGHLCRARHWTGQRRCRPARPPVAARLRAGGRPQSVLACWQTPRPRDDVCPGVGWGTPGVMTAVAAAPTVPAAAPACCMLGDGPCVSAQFPGSHLRCPQGVSI